VYGVVTARVTDVEDKQNEGRVKISYPWLPGNQEGYWAPVATMMAGRGCGSWFMPEEGDDVLVAFDKGDITHPYIVGFLWNGQDTPPRQDHQVRVIQSVNGHMIEIYDPDVQDGEAGYIRLKDAYGNVIELANGQISMTGVWSVSIDAPNIIIKGRPVLDVASPI
jgi:uncharacterized protein involved in type VI secretion and phage assembly